MRRILLINLIVVFILLGCAQKEVVYDYNDNNEVLESQTDKDTYEIERIYDEELVRLERIAMQLADKIEQIKNDEVLTNKIMETFEFDESEYDLNFIDFYFYEGYDWAYLVSGKVNGSKFTWSPENLIIDDDELKGELIYLEEKYRGLGIYYDSGAFTFQFGSSHDSIVYLSPVFDESLLGEMYGLNRKVGDWFIEYFGPV